MQTSTYTAALSNSDAYVYKYQFDHASSMNCLYENVMDRTMLGSSTIQLIA